MVSRASEAVVNTAKIRVARFGGVGPAQTCHVELDHLPKVDWMHSETNYVAFMATWYQYLVTRRNGTDATMFVWGEMNSGMSRSNAFETISLDDKRWDAKEECYSCTARGGSGLWELFFLAGW